MGDTFHLRIKKEYAAAMIEQLKKDHAIEIIEDAIPDIPEWQKEALRKRLPKCSKIPQFCNPGMS